MATNKNGVNVNVSVKELIDYSAMVNKPTLNGKVLDGNHDNEYYGIINDRSYVHEQAVASNTWTITHNLGKKPSVTIVDSADTEVIGQVTYVDLNTIIVSFTTKFSGTAYLN